LADARSSVLEKIKAVVNAPGELSGETNRRLGEVEALFAVEPAPAPARRPSRKAEEAA
jgi:hypothetical protein